MTSVVPQQTFPQNGGVSTTVGFTSNSVINIAVSNITPDKVAQVIDLSTANGGNNVSISSPVYSLSDALSYNITVAARRQAAQDAKVTAQTYADVSLWFCL